MSFKKKLLSTAMAVAMVSGFAISQNASAVHLAEDGIGQVLLAPYYSTLDGQTTKFAIYNTRDDVAVKVKVVIRSYAHSTESRDFICYMTPADVCRFELVNKDGQAWLTSTDDSVRNSNGSASAPFANQSPLSIILDDTNMKVIDINDINEIGHVEVIGAFAVPMQGVHSYPGNPNIARGMLKAVLAPILDAAPAQLFVARGGTLGAVSNDPDLVRLSGDVVIESADGKRIAYRIPALAGKQGDNITTSAGSVINNTTPGAVPGVGPAFDGRVIANNVFNVTVQAPTMIGQNFGVLGTSNEYELEHALATTRITGTYEASADGKAGTGVFVTFPTKYIHRGRNICFPGTAGLGNVQYSAPFQVDGTVSYGLRNYDNSEQLVSQNFSPFPKAKFYAEVNRIDPRWDFDSGFYDVQIASTGCGSGGTVPASPYGGYDGVPALAMTYKYNGSGALLIPAGHVRSASSQSQDSLIAYPVGAPGTANYSADVIE